MKRLTTDNPKDNTENALNLFYIKDRETWVRRYGPPPEYLDISLDNLMRGLIAKFLPEVECPQNPVDFSFMMAEWLYADEVDTMEGTLALLYNAAWAYAELRHRLMAYEDTGLIPEDLRSTVDIDYVRIVELLKAEAEGRLLVPPCKVGQAVYFVLEDLPCIYPETNGWYIGEAVVTEVCTRGFSVDPIDGGEEVFFYPYDDIGKIVFLTRGEAEAALATAATVGSKPVNDLYDEDGGLIGE